MKLVDYMARVRSEYSRKANLIDMKVSSESGLAIDTLGAGGELAYCRLMNVYPDLDPHTLNIADCTLHDGSAAGTLVDVKTTSNPEGKLYVAPWKRGKVDLFVLMVANPPTFTYRGSLPSIDMIAPYRLKPCRNGEAYVAEQWELE